MAKEFILSDQKFGGQGWREATSRSVVKAVSYRVFGSVATAGIAWIFTGQALVALAIGGLETFVKLGLFFVHERAWNRISFGKQSISPAVIWFTGLSGSGKTTLSRLLADEFRKLGLQVELLDGDTVRSLFPKTGYSREERNTHIQRIGHLAACLERNGVFPIVALISPYQESRTFARSISKNFIEIYLSTSLEVCEKRDVKGLYSKARQGVVKNFTGINDPYEPPSRPEIVLDTSRLSESEAAFLLLKEIKKRL